jgi:hypothetical protein
MCVDGVVTNPNVEIGNACDLMGRDCVPEFQREHESNSIYNGT